MELTKKKLEELHIKKGISLEEIGKMYGLSYKKVVYHFRYRLGMKSPKRRSIFVSKKKVLKMYKEGMNCQEIANILSTKAWKVGDYFIRKIVNEAGIMRSQSEI